MRSIGRKRSGSGWLIGLRLSYAGIPGHTRDFAPVGRRRQLIPTAPPRRRSAVSGAISPVRLGIARCPITRVSIDEAKGIFCPVCHEPVKRTAPVGPPTADHRVPHLQCWIRTRQEVTDHFPGRQRRRRRSRRWQRRSGRKRVILFIGSVLVFALAILAVLAFEWLLDLAVK